MAAEDAHATRGVQREMSRRAIDITRCDIRVSHGVCYIRGIVSKMRGHDVSLEKEMGIIQHIIRQKFGIREVVVDVAYR